MKINLTLTFLLFFGVVSQAQNRAIVEKLTRNDGFSKQLIRVLEKENKERKTRIQEYLNLSKSKKSSIENPIYDIVEGQPIYLVNFNNTNAAIGARTNYIQPNGELGLNLEGEGITVGVWEVGQMAKEDHVEFTGSIDRVKNIDVGLDPGSHGTHVTGTLVAQGIEPRAKGMAPKSKAYVYDSNEDRLEVARLAIDSLLLVSNHSYGVPLLNNDGVDNPSSLFGTYTSDSRNWDLIANASPYLLSVHSAGNNGREEASEPSVPGGDKLSGPKISKNTLTVGSANFEEIDLNANGEIVRPSFGSVTIASDFSSQGPTDDFRVKPDLLGVGERLFSTSVTENSSGEFVDGYATLQGTSMAAPNVAGTLLLLQELYYRQNNTFMKSATAKALLCTTASDVGRTGPDIVNGWGLINAKKAANVILENNFSSLVLEKTLNDVDRSYTVEFTITNNINTDVGLVWNDPAGTANNGDLNNSTPNLVNDLDLKVIGPNNEEIYPWKLDETDTRNSALRGINDRDNVEIINLENADTGTYKIVIDYKNELAETEGSKSQEFSLVVTNYDQVTLSNQSFNTKSIVLWPNPVKNRLNISSSEINFSTDVQVSVYDMLGRKVIDKKDFDSTSSLSIDTSTLSKGIYILNLTDGAQSIQKRIIKE
ncbi:S8 family serine peptidase [Psychroflexus sp. CAK57W]|uniref:S8 family serine peptidase n=1 Tax=Psychroflexus curvus TaxID=2873595 RepID=UPI001CCE47AD|nr:S8 family serine peptidase [Psychroflexus curvus]MBZ9788280.1 S8 family serine peptidase [Psychroflexus curvus]